MKLLLLSLALFGSTLASLRAGDGQWSKKREAANSPHLDECESCMMIYRNMFGAECAHLCNQKKREAVNSPSVHVDSSNTASSTNEIKYGKREAGGWDVDIQSTNTGNANSQNTVTYNKRETDGDWPDWMGKKPDFGNGNHNSAGSHNNVPPGTIVHSTNTVNKKREAANSPSVHVDSSNTASSTNDIIFNKREASEEQNYACSCSDISFNGDGHKVCNECDGNGCRNVSYCQNGKRDTEYMERVRRSIQERAFVQKRR